MNIILLNTASTIIGITFFIIIKALLKKLAKTFPRKLGLLSSAKEPAYIFLKSKDKAERKALLDDDGHFSTLSLLLSEIIIMLLLSSIFIIIFNMFSMVNIIFTLFIAGAIATLLLVFYNNLVRINALSTMNEHFSNQTFELKKE